MFQFIIGLIIFIAVILIIVVLAQNSKGGGLSSQFGGSGASQLIGVKRTGDLLEKITWYLIIGIFVLSLGSAALVDGNGTNTGEGFTSPNEQKAQENGPAFAPDLTAPTENADPQNTTPIPVDSAN